MSVQFASMMLILLDIFNYLTFEPWAPQPERIQGLIITTAVYVICCIMLRAWMPRWFPQEEHK